MLYLLVFVLNFVFIVMRAFEIYFVSRGSAHRAALSQFILTVMWAATAMLGYGKMINDQDFIMAFMYCMSSSSGTFVGTKIGSWISAREKSKLEEEG